MRLRPEIILLVLGVFCAVAEVSGRYRSAPLESATWLIGDSLAYRDVTRSLLEHGSLDYRLINPTEMQRYQPGNGLTLTAAESNVALTVGDVPVPLRSILLPVVMVIPYALGREYGLLVANVLQCLLLVLLTYWLARRYFTEPAALLAACGFLAASTVRNFMYNVSPDVLGAVLVLGGVVLVWKESARPWQRAAGGALIGLSLWLRPLNLVAVASLLPALVAGVRQRRLLPGLVWPLVGLSIGAGGYLILNTVWFGHPLLTGYDRTLVMRNGVRSLATVRDSMNRPLWAAIIPTLFTHNHGFLQTAPYWPLFVPALASIGRRSRPEAAVLALLAFAPVAFLLKFDFWEASHFGNRFMFVPAAVTAMAIAWLVDRHAAGKQGRSTPRQVAV